MFNLIYEYLKLQNFRRSYSCYKWVLQFVKQLIYFLNKRFFSSKKKFKLGFDFQSQPCYLMFALKQVTKSSHVLIFKK